MKLSLKTISFAIYLISFLFSVRGDEYLPGFLVFIYGPFLMINNPVFLIWLANVSFIASFIPNNKTEFWRPVFCLITVCVGLLFFVFFDTMLSDAHIKNNRDSPATLGVGYGLWLSAFVTNLIEIIRFKLHAKGLAIK